MVNMIKKNTRLIRKKFFFQSYEGCYRIYSEIRRVRLDRFPAIEKINDSEKVLYMFCQKTVASKNNFPRSELCTLELSQKYYFYILKLSNN